MGVLRAIAIFFGFSYYLFFERKKTNNKRRRKSIRLVDGWMDGASRKIDGARLEKHKPLELKKGSRIECGEVVLKISFEKSDGKRSREIEEVGRTQR